MKKQDLRRMTIAAVVILLFFCGPLSGQDKSVPKTLVTFANEKLSAIGKDTQLAAFVETDNKKPASVEKLKQIDTKWANNDGIDDFIKAMLANPVSARLKKLTVEHKFILESFIMNAQGAIIGETNRTSTYYKGEAAKFTGAYKGGVGAIWYGPVEYDASVKANVLQISVPVIKGGKAIGAICFSISLEEWEKR